MSKLTKWSRSREAKRWGYYTGHPEELWRRLIAKHAPGRTFLDVGCMWQVNGDYAFYAVDKGASGVTGIDVNPVTQEFTKRNETLGNPVRFLKGDLNDPTISTWAGTFDVVFCSGVLYHVPNPVFSLGQLRNLCSDTLILATACMPERDEQNVAVLLAGLDDAGRKRLIYSTSERKLGLDSRFNPGRGYANWVWLPTPSRIRAMVTLAGFTVREFYPSRRVTTVVATPAAAMSWIPPEGR